MNIFVRELRVHRLGLLFWSLGMVALIGAGMAKFAGYEEAGESVEQLMSTLPRAVLVIFGMTGFYGVLFLYVAVMGAVHAVLLGSTLVSKEERDRTSEFLYAKPITRSRALTAKLLAGLANVVVLNVVASAASLYFVGYFGDGRRSSDEIRVLTVGLLLLQLVFLAVGAAVAGVARRPKAAPSRATSLMLVTFLLYYLVNLNEDLAVLRYFTPFKYVDAATLMADGALDPVFVALALVIVGAAIATTYRAFAARDLAV